MWWQTVIYKVEMVKDDLWHWMWCPPWSYWLLVNNIWPLPRWCCEWFWLGIHRQMMLVSVVVSISCPGTLDYFVNFLIYWVLLQVSQMAKYIICNYHLECHIETFSDLSPFSAGRHHLSVPSETVSSKPDFFTLYQHHLTSSFAPSPLNDSTIPNCGRETLHPFLNCMANILLFWGDMTH